MIVVRWSQLSPHSPACVVVVVWEKAVIENLYPTECFGLILNTHTGSKLAVKGSVSTAVLDGN